MRNKIDFDDVSCGICGAKPNGKGKVFYWNRKLGIWLCKNCAEDFDPSDLTIYFDFRKKPNGILIQGLNYLEV